MIFHLLAASQTPPPAGDNNFVLIILAVVGSSALGAFLTGLMNRRKVGRDVEGVAVSTATGLITTLRDEITRKDVEHSTQLRMLREEVVALRDRLDLAERKAAAADSRADLAEANGTILAERLDRARQDLARHQARLGQLEEAMIAAGVPIPDWPRGFPL